MTTDIHTPTEQTQTAGALLRQYRESHGLKLEALASTLRVAASKLQSLESDRLDQLPDAMFARALALAVCRHLKADAAPVLAQLPVPDTTRLAPKNELGLNFPLERPSFLPQSSFLVIERFFTPIRWIALAIFVAALVLGLWPDIQPWVVFKNEPAPAAVVVPVAGTATLPDSAESKPDLAATNIVVTTVLSPAVASHAASAALNNSAASGSVSPASGGLNER